MERKGLGKKVQFRKCKCRTTPYATPPQSHPPPFCAEHEFSGVARSIKNLTLE